MASITDILTTVQQGVVAANNLVSQTQGSFNNIAGQLSSINTQLSSINTQLSSLSSQVAQLNTTVSSLSSRVGRIGEFVGVTISSGAAVTAASAATVNVTSISLGSGDWDVFGVICAQPSSAMNSLVGAASTISAAFPTNLVDLSALQVTAFNVAARQNLPLPTTRMNFPSSGTVFLVGSITGSSGFLYGAIGARRAAV